jgi:hypothetical protein
MKKLILTYGTVAGLIVVLMMIITFSTSLVNMENGEILGYSTMIIAFSTIFFAIKSYRDQFLSGQINFGKAFKIGLGITLVATLFYIVAWLIVSSTIAKDFMFEYSQKAIADIRTSGLPEAEMNTKISGIESFRELYKNPLVKIGFTFLEIFPVGLLVSLISAFILKKK